MPFKSEAQRRYMYSQHPEIARRWRKKYGPQKNLPARIGKKSILLEAWTKGKSKLGK